MTVRRVTLLRLHASEMLQHPNANNNNDIIRKTKDSGNYTV